MSDTLTVETLTPKEKAAVLLISLGKEYAAMIYKYLDEDEIGQLTLSISSIRRVDPEVRDAVIQEFLEICLAQKYISEGGIDYARELLYSAMGPEKANQLISKLSSSLQVRPFDFVRRADISQLLNFLQNEHPQTIAVILSYLSPTQAGGVLSSLPPEKQTPIVARIARMGAASPEFIKEAERILERKISSIGFSDQTQIGGIDTLVDIINSVDRSTEKYILETLELDDAELADEIRAKLFVFEDIAKMSNQAIQRVLKEVDNSELAIALKGATPEVSKAILDNVSKRLKEMIEEDMQFMGPVRVRDVEEKQQQIVAVIRRLEEAGEIIISRGKDDEFV